MHGALFDGQGFVDGLGEAKSRLRDARVLMVGAGGAGRAIAFALAAEGVGQLDIIDPIRSSLAFTLERFNAVRGRECARAADVSEGWDYDVVINASPADSDEAAPLFRDDCAPGFRDDLAPCLVGSAGDDCCQFIQARCQALRISLIVSSHFTRW
ncbi:ThiF family adenylyltransferase [Sinorhizobium sp. 7-81]|uniref:ThiF family adenylyltransferase n=1 Tax=Sinorhizobium sp. 8-89 TaxID=3049089 RepID=UPI0024C3FEFB|nr:ThiF family adenylyltransferase [Sinorhizobium sp. 8-89]MDK1494264.1 ThiF family adenylyltransferase [Sinorhizobium sp. 8-89]